MTELARYLNENEKVLVEAALEPFKRTTFTHRGHGSFAQFAALPSDIRFSINHAVTEHGKLLDAIVVYEEPEPAMNPNYYAFGVVGAKKRLTIISPPMSPPTPHIVALAKERTKPWSAWGEINSLGFKDFAGFILAMTIGVMGLVNYGPTAWPPYFFIGLGLLGLSTVFVSAPLRHHFRRLRVLAALNGMSESSPAPTMTPAQGTATV